MTYETVHRAIKRGDVGALRVALGTGLDPNLANRYGWTILMVAAMHGNTAVGALLIGAGANLDLRNQGRDTALSLAVHTGHPSFVALLLSSGASLNCNPFGDSLDSFFNWVAQYGCGGEAQIKRIREMFEHERTIRAQANE
jgi:ankyrin repeat protein